MSREIKFRAFIESPDGSYIVCYSDPLFPHLFWDNVYHAIYDTEPQQYTGLKDKNGKEIYEGDVVKWSDGSYDSPSNPRIAIVEFSPELAFYAVNCTDFDNTGKYGAPPEYGHKFGYSNFAYKKTEDHLEVIGNLYQNPELIEAQNEH